VPWVLGVGVAGGEELGEGGGGEFEK